MAVTIEALRSYGTRRVTIHCSGGIFDGSIVPKDWSEHTVMLLFALYHDAQTIVIDINGISDVVER